MIHTRHSLCWAPCLYLLPCNDPQSSSTATVHSASHRALAALVKLRQSCCHPELARREADLSGGAAGGGGAGADGEGEAGGGGGARGGRSGRGGRGGGGGRQQRQSMRQIMARLVSEAYSAYDQVRGLSVCGVRVCGCVRRACRVWSVAGEPFSPCGAMFVHMPRLALTVGLGIGVVTRRSNPKDCCRSAAAAAQVVANLYSARLLVAALQDSSGKGEAA